MANSYLNRTSGTASLNTKMTFSVWAKRSLISSSVALFSFSTDSNNELYFRFMDNDTLQVFSQKSGTKIIERKTNRVFRDASAFYHLVLQIDTTQSTASDRVKFYVNGVQETSFSAETNPSQNEAITYVSSATFEIGRKTTSTNLNFNGYMSHASFVDGSIVAPTVFGETDSTSGIWKFKSPAGVTWGTNGFHLKFENSGNLGLDSSGNSNTFTVNGDGRQALDTPTNVHATLSSIDKNDVVVLGNGNTTSYSSNNGTWSAANRTTLGIASGKFYWEMKITGSGTANGLFFGVCSDTVRLITNQGIQDSSTERAKGVLVFCDDGQYQLDTNSRASMTSAPAFNDILGCAVDRDNNTVKFYKNGSQVGSIDISSSPLATCSHIMPLMINFYTNTKFNFNFGNGYFGTTAITSAGSNGNGSLFEYDVPSGYYALNTKNINTYG